MKNVSKLGITALAGSLVSLSSIAVAADLSVSGGARLGYSYTDGESDKATNEGNRFGMQHSIAFTGSGELDNGFTVSMRHELETDGNAGTNSNIAIDMGAMGNLTYYQAASTAIGLDAVKDITPSAFEEVDNGFSSDDYTVTGKADTGRTGFNYSNTVTEGVTLNVGYSPRGFDSYQDDGVRQGTGADTSGQSVHVDATVIDGLRVVVGTGTAGDGSNNEIDYDLYGVTYSYGPVTAGYQNTDREPDATSSEKNVDRTAMSIAFAINENFSVSYGKTDIEIEDQAYDTEITGISAAYSMGGMSFRAHANQADGLTSSTSDHEVVELELNFAF